MSTPSKTIRCQGAYLKIPGTTPLKTTDATLDLNAGTLRLGYEPTATQQAAFVVSPAIAISIAIAGHSVIGGVGMVLLYFLIYTVMAGITVRNVEFDLASEVLWADKQAGLFGFQVRKNDSPFFLGFKAKAALIELIEPICQSSKRSPIQKQSGLMYPASVLICGVLLVVARALLS